MLSGSQDADTRARFIELRRRADLCMRAGRYREGIAYFHRLDGAEHRLALAHWLRQLGCPAAALAALEAVGEGASQRRVELLIELNRRDEAMRLLRAEPPDGWAAEQWVRLGELGEAESIGDSSWCGRMSLWRGDGAPARKLGFEAIVAAYEGRETEALRALADRGDYEALLWLGELQRRRGQYALAVATIDRGITAAPSYCIAGHVSRLLAVMQSRDDYGTTLHPDAFEELGDLLAPLLTATQRADLSSGHTAKIQQVLSSCLQAFAGNRTIRPTFVRDGRLHALATSKHSRFSARDVQEQLRVHDADEVVRRLMRLYEVRAEPTVLCHVGEVHLWVGDYGAALAAFEAAIADTPEVRWAYVGLCAAEMMRERYDEALRWCERGIDAFPPPGRTLYAYRGEVFRRVGDLSRARADTERMLSETPERMTSWINLALIEPAHARATYDRLIDGAPGLMHDAAGQIDVDENDTESLLALFEHLLVMMRGNRSSSFVTYFTKDGALRFVPPK